MMSNMSPPQQPISKLGVIVRWDEKRGFGFIAQEHAANDIFLHRVCLTDRTIVNVGQVVKYDFFWDDRKNKYQATFCAVVDNPTKEMCLRLSHKCDIMYYEPEPYRQQPAAPKYEQPAPPPKYEQKHVAAYEQPAAPPKYEQKHVAAYYKQPSVVDVPYPSGIDAPYRSSYGSYSSYQTSTYGQEKRGSVSSWDSYKYQKGKSDSITETSTICESSSSGNSEADDDHLYTLPFDLDRKNSHAFSEQRASNIFDLCFKVAEEREKNPLTADVEYDWICG